MNEMLANHYFLARKYSEARTSFLECLQESPDNKHFIKKLILCYTQTGEIDKAFNLFYKLISENIEFIINTNPVEDDCPCLELIDQIQNSKFIDESMDYYLRLGIIWLYCNPKNSLENFRKAAEMDPSNPKLFNILKILSYHTNNEGETK